MSAAICRSANVCSSSFLRAGVLKLSEQREAAYQACNLVGVWQNQCTGQPAETDLATLPEALQRPVAALMHAAVAYYLAPPYGSIASTLRWAGRVWDLTLMDGGRLHIASSVGAAGLLTWPIFSSAVGE